MFRLSSVSSKLLLSVAISVILATALMIAIVSFQVASYSEKEAKDTIFLSSKRYVNYIQGMLNEEVTLTKGVATSLNEMFQNNDHIDIDLIESLIKNTFDSSHYAAYTFLYLKDTTVLSDMQNVDKKYISPDGKTFSMIFFDQIVEKSGGITTISTPNNFSQLNLIQNIEQNAKYGDKDSVFVDSPRKLNYDNNEFLGINFGMPIFNNKGKFIGVIGYTIDLLEISETILDPKFDFFEGDLRFLMNDQGIIAIHKNKNAILKTLFDINKDQSAQLIVEAVKNHKDEILDNYIASTGDLSYASISSFSTLGNSSHWSVIVTAPKKSVLAPLYKLQYIIISVAIIALIAILAVVYFFIRKIIGSRIPLILKSLENFFRFLNHEKIEVQTIEIKANDELGKMGKIINNTSDNNNSKTINTKKNTQKDNNNTQKNQPNLSNDNTLKTKTPNSNTPSLKNTSKEESIHKVSFSFHITNKNINFKDLGLDEQVLQEALNDYKKESISVQDLQDIANIISYYVQVSGYPAATAYIPQQELKDQIQINITLGVLGKYVVQNNSSVRDYAIESKLPNHKRRNHHY